MTTGCAVGSQCKIVTKFQINKTKQHFVQKKQIITQPACFLVVSKHKDFIFGVQVDRS